MPGTVVVSEVIPSARRLITSLRDVGYSFTTAVADIVDNSIEAEATQIDIRVEFDGEDSWVRIADNGKGMTEEELLEAMRYGSEREYSEKNLGKFGLGLKTASLSQCRRLTVASRSNPGNMNLIAWRWDLEHIERENRWEVIRLNNAELEVEIAAPFRSGARTVVLWERLDRILGYKHPYGEPARKRLLTMCRELEEHLGVVFHLFLTGLEGSRVRMTVNDNEVQPWDPFVLSEPETRTLPRTEIRFEHDGIRGSIYFEPYILPRKDSFTSPDAFKQASGPNNWNQQQGFYIYRAGRLVQSGGWCRLRTLDEHTKLARVALRFLPVLDEAFKINVAKMHVQLPGPIKEEVKRLLEPVIKVAQETYRQTSPAPVGPGSIYQPVWNAGSSPRENRIMSPDRSTFDPPVKITAPVTPTLQHPQKEYQQIGHQTGGHKKSRDKYWTLDELYELLISFAESEESPVIESVFERLRNSLDTSRDER